LKVERNSRKLWRKFETERMQGFMHVQVNCVARSAKSSLLEQKMEQESLQK